jgi:hypothetical protein
MSKIIEARAVISAADKTGNVFDAIAKKFKGIEKAGKSLEGIKAPKFTGDMFKELERLKLSEKELQGVRKSFGQYEQMLKEHRPKAEHYFRAMNDWQGKTVDHWRNVKAAAEDADKSHKKFFKGAGNFALHAAGIGGAAYATGHAIRAGAVAASARNRAGVRYEQMGLSDGQLGEGNVIADSISSKFPSISRTEVLDYLRSNASRLGSWDRSKEVAEPFARAMIANKLNGGDEHEMEQVVRALEGMGKANSSEQLVRGLNAFSKAKAANPDYTGEQFRTDMAAASSAKYAMSQDYMENVFPILASHTSGFGNKLSTGLSAMVGNRMTARARKALTEDGLFKDGKLIDQEGWISNNFDWTQHHIRPLLEKQGVKFGEDMSEEDKAKAVKFTSAHFSAKNAADLVLTNLLDQPLVERARSRHTVGLEKMDDLQRKDAGLAFEGVKKQLLDASTAVAKIGPVIDALNSAAKALGNFTKAVNSGKVGEDTRGGRWLKELGTPVEALNERTNRENLAAQAREIDGKLAGGYLDDATARKLRLRRFDLQSGIDQSNNAATMPSIYSDAEMEQWQERAREHNRGNYGSRPGAPTIPTPTPRPAEAGAGGMPPVQSLEGANVQATLSGSAEVHGEVKQTIVVEASEYLKALVQKMENGIKLIGSLTANGPGSTGKSSPDAAAPAVGFNGVP